MDATQTHVEIWKPVAGYEGRYSVSNLGRVKSLKRVTEPLHGGHPRICPETILKGEQNTRDHHYRVRLYINTETRRFLVHRLVLTAFVGPCPDGMVGCHNNGDPTDNRVENLRWDTRSENVRDQIDHGNHLQASKTHCKYGHEIRRGKSCVRPYPQHAHVSEMHQSKEPRAASTPPCAQKRRQHGCVNTTNPIALTQPRRQPEPHNRKDPQ